MKQRVWVGCDPGSKGSICALQEDGQTCFQSTIDHPMNILAWFSELAQECIVVMVMVENVHAIFGAGAASTFKFGYNAAVVELMPMAAGLSVDKVNPKQWQKAVGVRSTIKGKDIKSEVASICKRLYPKAEIHGPKGGLLDGRSDALMLAHYAKLKYR